MELKYRTGNRLEVDQVIELFRSCSLGERRPVSDRQRFRLMIEKANLIVSAWDGDLLVGLARSLTDWCYVTYLADLAVRESHQRQGIGRELIRRTRAEGGGAQIVLLSAPQAMDYYPHLGFEKHPSAWVLGQNAKLL